MNIVKKLPQELINQIAAGEVVERPSSVIKELVDNSIDAGATKIEVKIEDGGMKLIEIADNGTGIDKSELTKVFEPHTTSKITTIEDLNTLLTMGFRGEALSTIVSVSEVEIASKEAGADFAHTVSFNGIEPGTVKKAPRDQGTTISVKNIFANIPARQKFLKTAQTEYRKIVDILIPYFLIYPNIQFTLTHNRKVIYNLTKEDRAGMASLDRIKSILNGDFVKDMIEISGEAPAIKISGFIGHPSSHISRTKHQYIFVNERPVWDSAIAKAAQQAYSRYIPQGHKVPFILKIEVPTDQVDVNVHPRKEEVKFLNPYRIFSGVETVISAKVAKEMSYSPQQSFETPTTYPTSQARSASSSPRDIRFDKPSGPAVQRSLAFSQEVLKDAPGFEYNQAEGAEEEKPVSLDEIRSFHQIFNKYIIVEFPAQVWIFDQHAAAERITFERLKKNREEKKDNIQKLLVPSSIPVDESTKILIEENLDFFKSIGFEVEIGKKDISITTVPVQLVSADFERMIRELVELVESNEEAKNSFEYITEDVLASIACHQSIRAGQRLESLEMKQMFTELLACENPYSCPHGRPIVWKMSIEEVDKNFDRTY